LPEDKLVWIGNKRGEFTVKSAYFVATKLLNTRDEGNALLEIQMLGFGEKSGY